MYILEQLSVAPNRRIWTLVDTTTNLPLLFPLLFLIDRLSLRSESTQSSTLQALKFFYEYWYQKHDVTFCLSFQLSRRLSAYRSDFRPSKQKHSNKHFNSLTEDMVRKFYEIIRPESSSKPNPINPFPAGEIQFRNYLICRLLLNYGLRVSELLLLEKNSIKPNIKGVQFSIIVTSVDDDVRDPRKRLPSLKNSWAHRVLALDINDYNHLKIYIDKIRKKPLIVSYSLQLKITLHHYRITLYMIFSQKLIVLSKKSTRNSVMKNVLIL